MCFLVVAVSEAAASSFNDFPEHRDGFSPRCIAEHVPQALVCIFDD